MKLLVKQNATSRLATVFVQNNSVTTGAGLTGLVFNTAGLTAYYFREGDAASTQIVLATMTAGTWATGGLIVVDGTNMPGVYQLGLPNACFTALGSVVVYLQGAANMAPVVLEFQVVAFDPTDAVHLGLSALPNTACTTNASLLTSGTGTDQIANAAGKVLLQATQAGVTIPTVTTVTANVAVGSIANGAITDAAIAVPAEAAGRPTTFLAMMRRVWEWSTNARSRNRSTGAVTLSNAAGSGTLETQTQQTVSSVDSQSKGA